MGKGAAEYLVILAVVIIVALIIIVLLGWFPGLGGAAETQSRGYWMSAQPFRVKDYRAASGGSIELLVENTLQERAKITNIEIAANNTACNVTGMAPSDYWLKAGEEKKFSGNLCGGIQCGTGNAGDLYELQVTVYYDRLSITGNMQQGERPLVGKCA